MRKKLIGVIRAAKCIIQIDLRNAPNSAITNDKIDNLNKYIAVLSLILFSILDSPFNLK